MPFSPLLRLCIIRLATRVSYVRPLPRVFFCVCVAGATGGLAIFRNVQQFADVTLPPYEAPVHCTATRVAPTLRPVLRCGLERPVIIRIEIIWMDFV